MPKPTTDVGRLRHTLIWQVAGLSEPGEMGERPEAWATKGTFRAAVEPIQGAMLFQAAQLKSTTTYKIIARGGVGPISPGDRLVYEDGRTFSVVTVFRPFDLSDPYQTITANELNQE